MNRSLPATEMAIRLKWARKTSPTSMATMSQRTLAGFEVGMTVAECGKRTDSCYAKLLHHFGRQLVADPRSVRDRDRAIANRQAGSLQLFSQRRIVNLGGGELDERGDRRIGREVNGRGAEDLRGPVPRTDECAASPGQLHDPLRLGQPAAGRHVRLNHADP